VDGGDRARGQDLLHHRAADLGDGDQDGADAHPDPALALGLFLALAGTERIVYDADPEAVGEEPKKVQRKASVA